MESQKQLALRVYLLFHLNPDTSFLKPANAINASVEHIPADPVLIIGKGRTDLYLANKLLSDFPGMRIIRYEQVKSKNLKYYFRKLSGAGFLTSFGIKLLSVYLRLEIQAEAISGNTIWGKLGIATPGFPERIEIEDCKEINDLCRMTANSKMVIITQALRLPDRFFRPSKKVLQIVGGKFPEYCGDAAIFWATAQDKHSDYCFSVIQRHKYFRRSELLRLCPVVLEKGDSLRMMRAKGIVSVAQQLPDIILQQTHAVKGVKGVENENMRLLSTPTLADYLKVVKQKMILPEIPSHAISKQ